MMGILARIVAALADGLGLIGRGPASRFDPSRPVCRVRRAGSWAAWPDHRYGTPADELAARRLLRQRWQRWKESKR